MGKIDVEKLSIHEMQQLMTEKVMDEITKGPQEQCEDILEKASKSSKEIRWFAFETRIRKLVSEMLEPVQKRSNQTTDDNHHNMKQNNYLEARIDELDMAI